jgi:hypothetical protein
MPKTLQYVLACYRALLWLYPAELRTVYGCEMVDVFERQLWSEWTSRGSCGVLVTAYYAIRELFTIALPGQLLNQRMIAPGLSLVITSAMLASLVAMLQDRALAQWINHKFLFGGLCH